MAQLIKTVRYLHSATNKDGSLRWYWLPAKKLRDQGWATVPLGHGGEAGNPPKEIIDRAEAENARLDAWRAGAPAPAALKEAKPRAHTVAALIEQYMSHDDYKTLSAGSKATYGYAIEYLRAAFGQMPAAYLQRKTVRAYHKEMEKRAPSMAAMFVTVGRIIYRNAISQHDMDLANPFADMGVNTAGEIRGMVWPRAMIDHMVEAADKMGAPSIGTGILLLYCLGQRPSDICKLSVRAWRRDQGRIFIVQKKTGAFVAVPPLSALQRRLELHPPKGLHMIQTDDRGVPWTTINFRDKFAQIRAVAAAGSNAHGIRPWAAVWAEAVAAKPAIAFDYLPPEEAISAELDLSRPPAMTDYQARDLRRTAVVRMQRAGCTVQEAASISGHTIEETTKIFEIYSPRDSETAGNAVAKIEAYERRQEKQG